MAAGNTTWLVGSELSISGCSAAGSAPALGVGRREFEPPHSDQYYSNVGGA